MTVKKSIKKISIKSPIIKYTPKFEKIKIIKSIKYDLNWIKIRKIIQKFNWKHKINILKIKRYYHAWLCIFNFSIKYFDTKVNYRNIPSNFNEEYQQLNEKVKRIIEYGE